MNTAAPTFSRSPQGRPVPDMQAVARGEPHAFALAVAALAAFLFSRAGLSIKMPVAAADVAHKAADNGPQAGLLAAAIDLRALLAQCLRSEGSGRAPSGRARPDLSAAGNGSFIA